MVAAHSRDYPHHEINVSKLCRVCAHYLHEKDDIADLRLTRSNIGLLNPAHSHQLTVEPLGNLLLFDAVSQIAAKLHRLQPDKRLDFDKIEHR